MSFYLSERMKDGHSRRDHYKAAGLPPEKWGIPDLPATLAHVWEWFCDLSAGRSVGMAANPISWADMQAYFALTGEVPSKFELDAIRKIDYMAINPPEKKGK